MALRYVILVAVLVGLGPSPVWGQDDVRSSHNAPDAVVERISTAFENGDVQRLLSDGTDRVEISLFGTRTFYSSGQAFYVLRDFFKTHPPANFVVDDATGAGKSCFVRGRFQHTRGERSLQVYVRLVEEEGDTWRVQEVRIDPEVE